MHLETIVKKKTKKTRKTTDRVPISTTTTMGSVAPNAKAVGDRDKGMIKALCYINFAVILSRCSSTSPPGPHPKCLHAQKKTKEKTIPFRKNLPCWEQKVISRPDSLSQVQPVLWEVPQNRKA